MFHIFIIIYKFYNIYSFCKKKYKTIDLVYKFENVKFQTINEPFKIKKKNKYFKRIIFHEKEIYTLINDIFVKNNLSEKISNLTGFNYSINFFTAYKTLNYP